MARKLRVISINFPFKAPWVVQEPTLATDRALFDFDVAVIRPYLLDTSKGAGKWEIGHSDYERYKGTISKKIGDITRLLKQGGLFVVIIDAKQELEFIAGKGGYIGSTKYTLSNYDFFPPSFYKRLINGRGDRVEIVDHAEPFSSVIKAGVVEWSAYISDNPRYSTDFFDQIKFFARNGDGSFVGGRLRANDGNIVFLPNFIELNEEKFFETCRKYQFDREGSPPPVWVEHVHLPGAVEANSKISKIEDHMTEQQNQLSEAERELDELLAYKQLLYEKGKTQLEPIVRRALDQLQFGTKPSETIKGTGFEIDGRTTAGSVPGILEIKGSKRQIGLDEYSPFGPKILADLEASDIPSKGILVGNGLCEESPEKRLGETVFSSHVLQAAKTQSVALVNTVELYCVVCEVLSGAISDSETIQESILTTNGFVNLMGFCRNRPF